MRFLGALARCALISQLAGSLASPIVSFDNPAQEPFLLEASGAKFTLSEQNEDICDAGSRQWTGWINVAENKKLFFWFFESRDKPPEDPVMVWLNGGPGGSSLLGLFTEIGPCQTNRGNNGTLRNPDSWTNFANVIFVE